MCTIGGNTWNIESRGNEWSYFPVQSIYEPKDFVMGCSYSQFSILNRGEKSINHSQSNVLWEEGRYYIPPQVGCKLRMKSSCEHIVLLHCHYDRILALSILIKFHTHNPNFMIHQNQVMEQSINLRIKHLKTLCILKSTKLIPCFKLKFVVETRWVHLLWTPRAL